MIATCVMQPYLFPYLGYWQMLAAVDNFVIFDDVNFINKGWINRNNILLSGKQHMFTLPLIKASQNKLIREIEIVPESRERLKILKTFNNAYKKAPFFDSVYPIIEKILLNDESNLSLFLKYHFQLVFKYLGISTKIFMSSEFEKEDSLRGADKIIKICRLLDTDIYINAIGGRELYSSGEFENNGMHLKFIKMRPIHYRQFDNDFVPFLSIVDVLMFNEVALVRSFLNEYDLV